MPTNELRHIGRNPPRLVARKQFRRRSPPRLILEIDVGELLPGGVLHDDASVVEFFNRPWRRSGELAFGSLEVL